MIPHPDPCPKGRGEQSLSQAVLTPFLCEAALVSAVAIQGRRCGQQEAPGRQWAELTVMHHSSKEVSREMEQNISEPPEQVSKTSCSPNYYKDRGILAPLCYSWLVFCPGKQAFWM